MSALNIVSGLVKALIPTSETSKSSNDSNAEMQEFMNGMMEQKAMKAQSANKAAIMKMADKMKESAAEDDDGDE